MKTFRGGTAAELIPFRLDDGEDLVATLARAAQEMNLFPGTGKEVEDPPPTLLTRNATDVATKESHRPRSLKRPFWSVMPRHRCPRCSAYQQAVGEAEPRGRMAEPTSQFCGQEP